MSGFKIVKQVISGATKILKLIPQKSNTDLVDELPTLLTFFNEKLYSLTGTEQECLKHIHKIYNDLPKDASFYFNIEKYENRESGDVIKTNCQTIGVGLSPADALSTAQIFGTITSGSPGFGARLNGHFVKAYFKNEELIFETIEGDYIYHRRLAEVLRQKKIKFATRNLDSVTNILPEELEYSRYWTNQSVRFKNDIAEQNIKDDIDRLNIKFQKAEFEFEKSFRLYNEYKRQRESAQKNKMFLNLILKGAEYIGNNISKDESSNMLNDINENLKIIDNQIDLIEKELLKQKNTINISVTEVVNIYRVNKIPIAADKFSELEFHPNEDIDWSGDNLLY